jgi:hypothetical protein
MAVLSGSSATKIRPNTTAITATSSTSMSPFGSARYPRWRTD